MNDTVREIFRVLGVWIKGQLILWASVTGLYLVGFAIARTPLWLLLAVLCGFARVVPAVGTLCALLLVLLFSYVGSGGDTRVMVAALSVWALVQLAEIFFIGPRLLGRRLGLNPWFVFLGGIAGAFIAGPVGILVATPVLAIAAVLWRRHGRKEAVKY